MVVDDVDEETLKFREFDSDEVPSDSEEVWGLGRPSCDSYTMENILHQERLKMETIPHEEPASEQVVPPDSHDYYLPL